MVVSTRAFSAGEVGLNVEKLSEPVVQLALQRERLAQARLITGEPGRRFDAAAALLFQLGVHAVDRMLSLLDALGLPDGKSAQ